MIYITIRCLVDAHKSGVGMKQRLVNLSGRPSRILVNGAIRLQHGSLKLAYHHSLDCCPVPG
jgi:hypothetical protein